MLSEDSVLRKLPHGLSKKQIVFLDALRVSAEIAHRSYDDVFVELQVLGENGDPERPKNLLDAIRHTWTFVDSVHRFRVVLQQAPGIRHNYVYELFIRKTKCVTNMRDTAQHLYEKLPGIAERSQGAYGTLTWVLGAGDDCVPKALMLNIGTAYGQVIGPITDLEERLPIGEIRRVRLELGERFLLLSDTYKRLGSMVQSIEGAVSELAEGKERFGSDQLIGFNLVPMTENSQGHKDI